MDDESDPTIAKVTTLSGEQVSVRAPRSRNWADRIPLAVLLGGLVGGALAAGELLAEVRAGTAQHAAAEARIEGKLDSLAVTVAADHDRIVRLEEAVETRSKRRGTP